MRTCRDPEKCQGCERDERDKAFFQGLSDAQRYKGLYYSGPYAADYLRGSAAYNAEREASS